MYCFVFLNVFENGTRYRCNDIISLVFSHFNLFGLPMTVYVHLSTFSGFKINSLATVR